MTKEELKITFRQLNTNSSLPEIQKYITKMMETNGFQNSALELTSQYVIALEVAKTINFYLKLMSNIIFLIKSFLWNIRDLLCSIIKKIVLNI